MILVGIFAYQLGGRALWLVPLTFVGIMAVGGFLGIAGVPVPFIEIGIALRTQDAFLSSSLSQAIEVLVSDGTIDRLLVAYGLAMP